MSTAPVYTLAPKLPGEQLIYSVDFLADLGGATITARSIVSTTGGTAGAAGGSGSVVSALISGGSVGSSIRALYQATTSDGQIMQCWIVIPIQSAP